jgi:hypothetical protein
MVDDQTGKLHWAVPAGMDVLPDRLKLRLDFYEEAIVLTAFEDGQNTVRLVDATQVALAIARDSEFSSGLLPKDALWWRSGRTGPEVAVWRSPRVWRVALMAEPLKPPRRFSLPMPGLVFICSRGHPPGVFAAKRRLAAPEDLVYQAPAFNVFSSGLSCQGTHHYGADLNLLPEEFFQAFFSPAGDTRGRSKKHPDDLLALWAEIDGQTKYPNDDLVEFGRVKDLLDDKYRRWR